MAVEWSLTGCIRQLLASRGVRMAADPCPEGELYKYTNIFTFGPTPYMLLYSCRELRKTGRERAQNAAGGPFTMWLVRAWAGPLRCSLPTLVLKLRCKKSLHACLTMRRYRITPRIMSQSVCAIACACACLGPRRKTVSPPDGGDFLLLGTLGFAVPERTE